MNAALSSPSLAATFAAEIEAEGILFDMDGVLVRSTGGDERCWRRWAGRHNLQLDIRRTHGRRAADTLREHLPEADDDAIRRHLAQLDTFAAEEQAGVIAYPGVKDLLQTPPPYRWTVVTSASEAMMRDRLRAAGIVAPARVVAGDHVAQGKPDPEGYRKGAALLSRSPGDCIVLEDAPAGVRAGKRAGCRVIGVLSSHPAEELQGLHRRFGHTQTPFPGVDPKPMALNFFNARGSTLHTIVDLAFDDERGGVGRHAPCVASPRTSMKSHTT